jgi:hypothetical protein
MFHAAKFSEFIALSIHAFIDNKCLLHCIYLVYYVIFNRKFCSRTTVQGFPGEVFEEPEVFFSGQQGKCP